LEAGDAASERSDTSFYVYPLFAVPGSSADRIRKTLTDGASAVILPRWNHSAMLVCARHSSSRALPIFEGPGARGSVPAIQQSNQPIINTVSKHNPMTKPNPQPASVVEAELGGVDGNVTKIRDILFGSQMRDYERKFAQLEDRLMKESADLREDVKRRFASLEAFIKGEIEALDNAQKAEKTERTDEVKELSGETKENVKRLEKRIAQLDEDHGKSQRTLRQLVLDESRRLSEEIGAKHADVTASNARELQEVRGILTDRHALSDLFAELSLRLKNEFKLPGE
jgi:hypothetical protein